MNRIVGSGFGGLIEAAFTIIPAPIRPLIECEWACGFDPVFAGLHSCLEANNNRSYRNIAHVVYPWHIDGAADRRLTTIVIPNRNLSLCHLVHEIGHVLHLRLDWFVTSSVSEYGDLNECEAFAEAFTSWCLPGYAYRPDDEFVALMESLL